MRLGPSKLLHGLKLPGGVKGEEFDYFHEMIITQELVRSGARGYADGLQGGMVIGLPPVMNYGSEELKKAVIPDVLAGKKFIALAISEAFAGSDVAGLRCTATKSADGKHYIVNGTKKWVGADSFRRCALSLTSPFADHRWKLCRLLLDGRQHWQWSVDAAHPSWTGRRDQDYQDEL